jgi:hypothetical protein
MGCLGVHFSLSSEEVQQLLAITDESARVDHLREVIEHEYFDNHRERMAQSDKAWDAMHRVLTDGDLTWDGGDYPLNHVVLGGHLLYTGDDSIMVLKTPDKVRDVAAALPAVTEADFRSRYFAIDPESYGFPVDNQDFDYTWYWFQRVREFWLRAALEGRYVLFTADQ